MDTELQIALKTNDLDYLIKWLSTNKRLSYEEKISLIHAIKIIDKKIAMKVIASAYIRDCNSHDNDNKESCFWCKDNIVMTVEKQHELKGFQGDFLLTKINFCPNCGRQLN